MQPLPRLLAVLLLAVAAGFAIGASAEARPPRAPDLRHVHRLQAVPAAQLAAFPVLTEPVAKTIPDAVLRSFQSLHIARTFETDPRKARAITGLRGTWFVIPGAKGMCLYVSAAATCALTADAVAGKLAMIRTAAPSGAAPGGASGDSPHTVVGLAPAGTTGVTVQLLSGAIADSALGPKSAYRVDVPEAFTTVSLTRTTGAPLPVFVL